ncbi:methyltransferase [Arcobacter sp. CECT 8985]|nr:methyltransferase [Arcobacter sp. CECT 8985]
MNKSEYNGKVLVILHRGHEHSERLESIAEYKAFDEYKKYSYDYRGHGYEKGEPSYEFMDLVRDLDCFIKFVQEDANVEENDIFIIANSVAGVVTSTWMHDYAPNIAGAALVAPAFKIKLYFPFAKEGLKLLTNYYPKLKIKSYVKSKYLTHIKEEQKKYDSDPLITPDIPAKQLVTLLDTAKRVVEDANMITLPILVLSARKDYVVDSSIQGDFYSNLSSSIKKFVPMEDTFHGILYDTKKDEALKEISNFIDLCFSSNRNNNSLYTEKVIELTQKQKDKMSFGSLNFFDKLNFGIQRNFIKYFGSISEGIKIGKKYGFDSGVTLDYIYKNRVNGKFILGKFIDKNYLNSIGWKGIRQRKINLEKLLKNSINELKTKNKEIKILDIAGGPAKYLVEIAKQYKDVQIEVRDYQTQNIQKGQSYIEKYNLDNIKYKQADAFDKSNYKDQSFKPNIVVISGVFELFDNNDLIKNAINGVSNILNSGDILLFTNQPWHPQLSQISNILMNHNKEKWIMRQRCEYEINQLFSEAGFKIEEKCIDNYGIFTVTKAKKI